MMATIIVGALYVACLVGAWITQDMVKHER
jgi:hypothetical protein